MIRAAQNKDIDGIMDLLHQVLNVHAEGRPDIFARGGTKYTPGQLTEIIANTATHPVFVSVTDDDCEHVQGYCFCIVQDNTDSPQFEPFKSLYIDDLCVDSKLRRSGIGHMLYNYVCDYARQNGFYNITLNVWSCNPNAITFYETLGLKPQKITLEQIL